MAEILVIDDQDRTLNLCKRVMPEHDWRGPARSWKEAEDALLRPPEAVLLDLHFEIAVEDLIGLPEEPSTAQIRKVRQRQGIHILEALRQRWPDLPVVLMTARGEGLEQAFDDRQAEEYTYFLDNDQLDSAALRGLVARVVEASRGAERDGPVYWGRAPALRRIRQRLEVLARGRLPVVLGGATGTGKSLIARHFIHPKSGRKGRFVAVDLATIPRELVASQLFGSARGSFTGAVADRKGAFEDADGGTLFLDEVGNLPEDVQRMLLTVLQERALSRIGESKERAVDVKLVVATHEDLAARVREGTFRADLYMRLNPAATVRLPPLSERLGDLESLIMFTVGRLSEEGALVDLAKERLGNGDAPQLRALLRSELPERRPGVLYFLFPERTIRELRRHRWPGNLRELALTVENALNLSLAEAIDAGRGPSALGERPDVVQVRPKLVRDLLQALGEPEEAVPTPTQNSPKDGLILPIRIVPQGGLGKLAQEVERQYFMALYLRHDGDFTAMALDLLGEPEGGRKVQLRFNQLGLKVRELKERAR
jgi:DNA-binding NtrC family response regulator